MFDINDKNLIIDMLDRMYHYDKFHMFMEEPNEFTWNDLDKMAEELELSIYNGASKGVIIMDDCNFVIKLPFNFDRFDYCKAEWRNYLMAEQEGIGDCFAETHFVTMFHGMPVYAQEYCDCDESEISDHIYTSSYNQWLHDTGREANADNRDEFSENYDWDDDYAYYDMCVEEWGKDKACKFANFCDDNLITDLHSGNWACGSTLKAVDFSGFSAIENQFVDSHYDGEHFCVTHNEEEEYKWFRICDLAIAFDAA